MAAFCSNIALGMTALSWVFSYEKDGKGRQEYEARSTKVRDDQTIYLHLCIFAPLKVHT
jgi:hypothetical protein